jgi:hypothetical protein
MGKIAKASPAVSRTGSGTAKAHCDYPVVVRGRDSPTALPFVQPAKRDTCPIESVGTRTKNRDTCPAAVSRSDRKVKAATASHHPSTTTPEFLSYLVVHQEIMVWVERVGTDKINPGGGGDSPTALPFVQPAKRDTCPIESVGTRTKKRDTCPARGFTIGSESQRGHGVWLPSFPRLDVGFSDKKHSRI